MPNSFSTLGLDRGAWGSGFGQDLCPEVFCFLPWCVWGSGAPGMCKLQVRIRSSMNAYCMYNPGPHTATWQKKPHDARAVFKLRVGFVIDDSSSWRLLFRQRRRSGMTWGSQQGNSETHTHTHTTNTHTHTHTRAHTHTRGREQARKCTGSTEFFVTSRMCKD